MAHAQKGCAHGLSQSSAAGGDSRRTGRNTTIAFLPFFHIYGMVVIGLLGLWSGATLVVMPKFDLDTYLDLVERHRAPAELEALLLTHPAVGDAAVVPLKDEEAGEIPRAFVVLKAPATAEELIAFITARVASYKRIRRVDFIDAIPKSPSGKILRRLLRDVAVS